MHPGKHPHAMLKGNAAHMLALCTFACMAQVRRQWCEQEVLPANATAALADHRSWCQVSPLCACACLKCATCDCVQWLSCVSTDTRVRAHVCTLRDRCCSTHIQAAEHKRVHRYRVYKVQAAAESSCCSAYTAQWCRPCGAAASHLFAQT